MKKLFLAMFVLTFTVGAANAQATNNGNKMQPNKTMPSSVTKTKPSGVVKQQSTTQTQQTTASTNNGKMSTTTNKQSTEKKQVVAAGAAKKPAMNHKRSYAKGYRKHHKSTATKKS